MTLHTIKRTKAYAFISFIDRAWFNKRRKIWHGMLHLLKNNSRTTNPTVAFIVGSGRSGTDVVSYSLSRTFKTKLINEDNPIAFNNWRVKDTDTLKNVIKNSGASTLIFKPIVETLRIYDLLKLSDNSKAIFVMRNPTDAINSKVKFFGNANITTVTEWLETNFQELPLLPKELKQFVTDTWKISTSIEMAAGIIWLIYNASYLFLNMKNNKNIKLIDYDDFVQKPECCLHNLCDFLQIPYHSRMKKEIYSSSLKSTPKPTLVPELEDRLEQIWHGLLDAYQQQILESYSNIRLKITQMNQIE